MRRQLKRLTLSRETIHQLEPAELRQAAGQALTVAPCLPPPTHISGCPSFKLCPTQFGGLSCVEFCTPSEATKCD